jgi:multiple sugar transport system permease protein
LFVIYLVPIVFIVLTSLKSPGDVISRDAQLFSTPTFDAYAKALSDTTLFTAGLQSLIIATSTTALVLVVAVPAGYGLARVGGKLPTYLLGGLIVLQIMPQTAMVIPLFQIFGVLGILDQRISVILANSALLIPFAILLMRPFFRAIPVSLEEASALDGASSWRTFRTVILPLVRNGVATTGTLVFLISWGEFLYAVNFFLSPGNYPLSALLAQQVSAFGINWPGLMALAVITSIPILVLFAFTYRLLKDGLTLGAVK